MSFLWITCGVVVTGFRGGFSALSDLTEGPWDVVWQRDSDHYILWYA